MIVSPGDVLKEELRSPSLLGLMDTTTKVSEAGAGWAKAAHEVNSAQPISRRVITTTILVDAVNPQLGDLRGSEVLHAKVLQLAQVLGIDAVDTHLDQFARGEGVSHRARVLDEVGGDA